MWEQLKAVRKLNLKYSRKYEGKFSIHAIAYSNISTKKGSTRDIYSCEKAFGDSLDAHDHLKMKTKPLYQSD